MKPRTLRIQYWFGKTQKHLWLFFGEKWWYVTVGTQTVHKDSKE